LWRQFVLDLLAKSPNPRGRPGEDSYLKLSANEWQERGDELFQDLTLSDFFTDVAYKNGSKEDWKRAFKWLFPSPPFKTTKATQNYPDMRYFKTWLAFIENPGNAPSIQVTRAVLWKRVRTWKWIPDSQQDKVWPTKVQRSFSYWSSREGYRPDRPTAAPRILLQEQVKPVFFADR